MAINEFKYYYRHRACGQPAFYLLEYPEAGKNVDPAQCFQKNYTPIQDEEILCDSCGNFLREGVVLSFKDIFPV